MNRQHTHANWTLLPRGQFPERPNILLGADIELASSFIKLLLDETTLLLMLLAVLVLTFFVTIPNALAGRTLLEGITFLSACRTQLGFGPIFPVASVSLSFLSTDSPSDMEPSCSVAAAVTSCLDDAMVVLQINVQAASSAAAQIRYPLDHSMNLLAMLCIRVVHAEVSTLPTGTAKNLNCSPRSFLLNSG